MSADGVAYRSQHPEVMAAWEGWKAHVKAVRSRRDSMIQRFGRDLMVNRSGFGHGTRVVGVQRLDSDKPGEVLADGALRVPVRWSQTVEPNRRRKAGKDLEAEFGTLTQDAPSLPGQPQWTMVGARILAPAINDIDGWLWVRWSDDIDQPGDMDSRVPAVDADLWERTPLSSYFAALESAGADA